MTPVSVALRLYLNIAILWARVGRRVPTPVRIMIRHPFLTVAPLVIVGCLVAAYLSPNPQESPTMHMIPPTETAP